MSTLPRLALPLLLLACLRCSPKDNPASLWVSYAGREVNLVLIDHEPPPF